MITIGMLLYPGLTQLDLAAPFEAFKALPDADVHLVWKDVRPVHSDTGLAMLPTTTLDACPALDVVFVPGGFGQMAWMNDREVLEFLRHHGRSAKWVTSVCTGALLLGAAGLLEGYAATTHWAYVEMLSSFGARYEKGRVVVDRNRITGGGVTAGLDFALRVIAKLAGETVAKAVQLGLEYDPAPPFDCGHPDRAEAMLIELVRARFAERLAQTNVAAER